MQLDLLAIAAHPDDAELTCGGTLLKMVRRGYRVGILDLTRGEMGTRGSAAVRRREAAAAARVLGVEVRENLGLPDSRLEVVEKSKMAVARRIRALRPHVVILPYWEGRHPDHYNASRIAYEGCFAAGLKRLAIGGQPFRPFKIIYATAYDPAVRPSFVVDISEEYDERQRAILCYRSQFRPKKRDRKSAVYIPLDELDQRVGLVARHYGQMIGVRYGEPFLVKELFEVDDVVRMPVRSI
jgi:bacillithiol biosynthesis deacetylase BshB1